LFGHDSKTHKAFTIAVDRKLPKNLPNPPVDTSHLNNEEFGEFIRNN